MVNEGEARVMAKLEVIEKFLRTLMGDVENAPEVSTGERTETSGHHLGAEPHDKYNGERE